MSLSFLFVVLQECDRFTGRINSCRVTITGAAPKFLESKLNKAQAGRVEGDSERLWPSQWAQSSKHPKEMEPNITDSVLTEIQSQILYDAFVDLIIYIYSSFI